MLKKFRFTAVTMSGLLLAFFLAVTLDGAADVKDKDLIVYLPFEEGRGDKTTDLSQSGLTGLLESKGGKLAKWVDGPDGFGKALEFDGKTNFVKLDKDLSPHVEGTKELTICAWVKVLAVGTDGHGQTRQPIVMKGNSGEWEYALHVYDDFMPDLALWNCPGSQYHTRARAGAPIDLIKKWRALCGTYKDKGKTILYVDGKKVAESKDVTAPPCDGKRPIFIAHREDGQFLNAVIDDVRIYKRQLSDAEVAATMKAPLLAVEAADRLTTTWGRIKTTY